MEQSVSPTRLDKFKAFLDKTHLQYLVFAFLLYGFKAALYFIIAGIPNPRLGFFMMGDEAIPLVKFFYIFYLGYYFVPEIFLWILSFYDKRKVFDLIIGGALVNIICCTCFVIYQIKMQRPSYLEIPMTLAEGWENVHDLSTFFDRLLIFQYNADGTATNCYPSIHATFGTMLFLLGLPTSKEEVKKEHHFPIWCRIFCMIFGLGIVCSTFFVKQHYYIDAIMAMFLMTAMYFLTRLFIDFVLRYHALPKEEKKQRTSGYLYVGGLAFNAVIMMICFTMMMFGIFMVTGHVTPAISGSGPTAEIFELGAKYAIGFGLGTIFTGLIFAYYMLMSYKNQEVLDKKSNIILVVLGALTVNPLYLSSGIIRLNDNK